MTWLTAIKIVLALVAFFGAFAKLIAYYRGRRDMQREILLKSAEKCAEAAVRIAEEARRSAHEVESFNADTSVAIGNSLLSGTYSGDNRDPAVTKAADKAGGR